MAKVIVCTFAVVGADCFVVTCGVKELQVQILKRALSSLEYRRHRPLFAERRQKLRCRPLNLVKVRFENVERKKDASLVKLGQSAAKSALTVHGPA